MSETVRVVAPATLEEGFSFEATVDGQTFVVIVPEGGIKEGQEFEVPYPVKETPTMEEEDEYSTATQLPRGTWRTTLFSCCDVVTQATFWMAFFCSPIFLAQIMTRLKLSSRGRDEGPEEASMTFNRVAMTLVVTLFFAYIPTVGPFVSILYIVYMLFVGMRTRKYMRSKYDIAPITFFGDYAEDFCCMVWCCCCSTIQMARHTHDDKEYPGLCCTTNGLEIDAPEIEL
jgi:Cys-rich protein (TIGR01571 family)